MKLKKYAVTAIDKYGVLVVYRLPGGDNPDWEPHSGYLHPEESSLRVDGYVVGPYAEEPLDTAQWNMLYGRTEDTGEVVEVTLYEEFDVATDAWVKQYILTEL